MAATSDMITSVGAVGKAICWLCPRTKANVSGWKETEREGDPKIYDAHATNRMEIKLIRISSSNVGGCRLKKSHKNACEARKHTLH